MRSPHDPVDYRLQINALWTVRALLTVIDFAALRESVQTRGTPQDRLMVDLLDGLLEQMPERPEPPAS